MEIDEAFADGFVEPHLQVFQQLLAWHDFRSALHAVAAYATRYKAQGGYPGLRFACTVDGEGDPTAYSCQLELLLKRLFTAAEAALPLAVGDPMTTVRAPELHAVALLLERLPAPQSMAWVMHVCQGQLLLLPLEHLVDRVRDRALGTACVSRRLLTPCWFDPCYGDDSLAVAPDPTPKEQQQRQRRRQQRQQHGGHKPAPLAPQHGCNLLDQFLYALLSLSTLTSYGPEEEEGAIWPQYTRAPLGAAFATLSQAMVDRGVTATGAHAALLAPNLDVRGGALFAALLPGGTPSPDLIAQEQAAAICQHLGALQALPATPPLLPRLMAGLRPSELVALVWLTRVQTCQRSGLPFGRRATNSLSCIELAYDVPQQQAVDRRERRSAAWRDTATAAARRTLCRCDGAHVDPSLYVELLLHGTDMCLNAALAPGVAVPQLPPLPPPSHGTAVPGAQEVLVRTRCGTTAAGDTAFTGCCSMAPQDVYSGATATALVNAHLDFMMQHRPGVILAGQEEDAVRRLAPQLLFPTEPDWRVMGQRGRPAARTSGVL